MPQDTSSGNVEPPRPLELEMTPAEVAAALQHLPGITFFDTSGNLPSRSHAPVSIVAARPRQLISGDIHQAADVQRLREALAGWQVHAPSLGFPAGGACGWIDYEGAFCFGIYPEMLIYQHDRQCWWQCGRLSEELREPAAPSSLPAISEFTPSTTKAQYEDGVRRIHEYIAAGDIYQVNLTQRFSAPLSHAEGSLFPLYEQLRQRTPSPLAIWMKLAEREVLSSSPETFLRMSGRQIETRPIKGTRPRYADPERDAASASELLASEKEKAELIMITDLERNDLGQVCEFGSVRVADMLALEKLEQVYHLVSTVTGTLREEIDHLDALAACFPGGSITGAPKKRSMEIIEELEPVPRGLYTGAIGYLGFNGESQFNIPIRTLVRENETLHYHVGAGIVADSDPAAEYQETLDKAKGIRLAIEQFQTSMPDLSS
ncbi:aminodeoxychorismate synthase component I [Verrucomicrobiaceae bacterium 5K15]|uniref:Aminodeoxychorismate synthase component I n=1 Tax=Oceaniferula flava TaxID=2800421 RepID=A0AAE2VCT4_9BACT|nr:aminodeoxychorismate synthase component I [Oceaniferula flavus]MBK1855461.1 aminodeoxychorismate synthase component I [Oceaniferula flavus]MBM1136767.1 aminodeoxychorismate synthase component I [Oceaniferula flavus]